MFLGQGFQKLRAQTKQTDTQTERIIMSHSWAVNM